MRPLPEVGALLTLVKRDCQLVVGSPAKMQLTH
jgi:hypothetical protein